MIVYRFCQRQYKNDLSGSGARLYGGRWNKKGVPALYTSSSISLGLLEVLVNALSIDTLLRLVLMQIDVPDELVNKSQSIKLSSDWKTNPQYTQTKGTEFLKQKTECIMACPSAIITSELNYMLNPLHSKFDKISLLPVSDFEFDQRLFKK